MNYKGVFAFLWIILGIIYAYNDSIEKMHFAFIMSIIYVAWGSLESDIKKLK